MHGLIAAIAILLSVAASQAYAESECVREDILVRTTDSVEFGVVEASSAISISSITGEVRYQISNDHPEQTLVVGTKLPIGSMLFLEKGSRVTGDCDETKCFEVEAGDDSRNYMLLLPQC